ncbi:hypothetical protein ACFL7M_17715 [Thermodesulfobacteriota bacterium]
MRQDRHSIEDFLIELSELTKLTTTKYVPLDNDQTCPFCTYPFYETKNEPEDYVSEVECLNCNGTFYFDDRKRFKGQ